MKWQFWGHLPSYYEDQEHVCHWLTRKNETPTLHYILYLVSLTTWSYIILDLTIYENEHIFEKHAFNFT